MPRTLSGTITTAIALPVTSPGYLVYLGFDSPIRHSTRDTLTYGGYSWTGMLGTSVPSVSEQAATMELQNSDLAASALVLNTTLADKACQVYKLYNGDAVLLFDGFLDAAEIGERVKLTAKALTSARRVPRQYITYPTFKWLTPPGTAVKWGSQAVTLTTWRRHRKGA